MRYKQTIEWLYQQLPVYQIQGASAISHKLDPIQKFCTVLGNPQNKMKLIHIAGTNGKGSSSHMLSSVMQEAGYKTGLYTSPHLNDFRERIKINGTNISKKFVCQFVKDNFEYIRSKQLSFFELTVAMAFCAFHFKKVDIAIIETGLGGRLDSTNIITPLACLITNIGIDHSNILGDTLQKIAFEKAGIIKNKIPIIISEKQKETIAIFKTIATKKEAPLYIANQQNYKTDLQGSYQKKNINGVVTLLKVINPFFQVEEKDICLGLSNVLKNTNLKGRWQQLKKQPKVIADIAHNKEGFQYVVQQIKEEFYDSLHLVIGFAKDKDYKSILEILPKNAHYYFCSPNTDRGLKSEQLQHIATTDYNLKGQHYKTVKKAYKTALKTSKKKDLIIVSGSNFIIAEIL